MRHRSLVSAVSDEKKGSTITLQAVNELIASLESAGELSIREQKFLKLAKEFRICSASLDAAIKTGNVLADKNSQLAAENVGLFKDAQRYRFIRERDMFGSDNESGLLSWEELTELECNEFDDALDARINHPNTGFIELDAKLQARKTTATDRIVAGIKADGVKEFAESQKEYVRQHRNEMDQVLRAAYAGSAVDAERFAAQLREGADK
ncbi:TPA: hypothetical protein QH899_005613 [Klebsiella pneumoniae subsp. pneumoniae]|nr:hypothetical protein [Klebsiella pneumoniae subsp. pneumoniae]HDU4945820.1 hypothetical protein [Klebsiella pneumoniae subsp. ozaenae]